MQAHQLESLQEELKDWEKALAVVQHKSVVNAITSHITYIQSSLKDLSQVKNDLDPSLPSLPFSPITNYLWDQTPTEVKIYITLSFEVEESQVSCHFEKQSFLLTVTKVPTHGNQRLQIKKLHGLIDASQCMYKVKKGGKITVTLKKKGTASWLELQSKPEPDMKPKDPPSMKSAENPAESMYELLHKLYQDGDSDMKRTIMQAWTQAQDQKQQSPIF